MSARAQELFPSLRGQGMIAIDCETNDPDLKNSGPGYHRGGFICGVSIGTESGFRAYYPIAHLGGGNLDKTKVLSWLKAEVADANVPKVGANLGYDLGFLAEAGVDVRGPLYDIQLAEPLIDETRRSYSLEALAQHYLEEGKIDAALEEWITGNLRDDAGRKLNGRNFKSAIWRAPVSVVAPYAIGDIDLPLRIFAQQKITFRRGVAVDISYAEKIYRSMSRRQSDAASPTALGSARFPFRHKVPGARLARTYAALNARIQGSAADILKVAMSDIWASGVCDVLGPPLLSIHDELDWSVPKSKAGREALAEVKRIMENVVDISIKLTVDAKTGANWGVCK